MGEGLEELGIMTKENPTPLEALEKIETSLHFNNWWKYRKKDLDIIEKELEEGERNKQALKIIKEHVIYCENVDCFVFANITKEVNELLKEVLL